MKELLALLCLTTIITTVETCSCFPSSNEEIYCDKSSQFGIKIKAINLESTQQHGDSVYRIKKIKKKNIFRWETDVDQDEVDLKRIYTASDSGRCGVVLEDGQTYLVTGSIESGVEPKRLRVGICGIFLKWNEVEKKFKKFAKKNKC